jgi:hypothetical protein
VGPPLVQSRHTAAHFWLAVGLSVGQPIVALAIKNNYLFSFFNNTIHLHSYKTSSTIMADHMSKFNEYRSLPVGEQGWPALLRFSFC